MVNGKNKGNAFERLIYKDLRHKPGECKRSLGSGSSDEAADIYFSPKNNVNTYAIECKHYKKLTWYRLEKFWTKLNNEVKAKWLRSAFPEPLPVLIFRENREPIKVMWQNHNSFLVIGLYEDWKELVTQ